MFAKLKPYLFVLSLGLNIAFIGIWLFHAYPFYGRYSDKRGFDPKRDFYRGRLNVSDEQWEKLQPQVEDFFSKTVRLKKKLSAARRDMLELLFAEETEEPAIAEKKDEILGLYAELQEVFIKHAHTHRQALTEEQCGKFMKMLRRKMPGYPRHHPPRSDKFRPGPKTE